MRKAIKVEPSGTWTLECAIPLERLGVTSPPKPGDVWGFQVGRMTKGAGYTVLSAFWTGPHGIRKADSFGHLLFR